VGQVGWGQVTHCPLTQHLVPVQGSAGHVGGGQGRQTLSVQQSDSEQ
jgi:hypothetical protein